MRPIINKIKKPCAVCNKTVKPGDGFIYNAAKERAQKPIWTTLCNSSACFKRHGIKFPEKKKTIITADGKVYLNANSKEEFFEKLSLIRTIPGADYNNQVWTVSTEIKDLPRLFEIAKCLDAEIPNELREKLEQSSEIVDAKKRSNRAGLYEFQKTGVEFLSVRDKALLLDEQGLGKTIQTLVALPENAQVVLVCPASVKYTWQNEIKKWRPDYKTTILSGRDSFLIPDNGEIVILNYDILPSWLAFDKDKRKKIKEIQKITKKYNENDFYPEDLLKIKDKLKNIILIADEGQLLKNYKTDRYAEFSNLSRFVSKVWILTGTPLTKTPFDLWSVLSAAHLQNEAFGSFTKFCHIFNLIKTRFGYQAGTPRASAAEFLRRVSLRRLRKDVLKDLPEKQYKEIVVDIDSGDLLKDLDGIYADNEEIIAHGSIPKFREFSTVWARLVESRIPAMISVVESYEDSETPLVVFSAHLKSLKKLEKRDGWKIITGDTPTKERFDIIEEFQQGKLKGVGVSIKAGGTGITLTYAHHALFVDQDLTAANNVQAEDRLARIGQKNQVLITKMISNHILDIRINNILRTDMDLAIKAIDNSIKINNHKTPELKHETDEELEARLNKQRKIIERKNIERAKGKVHSILDRERSKSNLPEPELTQERKKLIRDALGYMILRCDKARSKDFMGFNKPDAAVAHWIYATGMQEDDDITYRVTERILSRYYKQLGAQYEKIWAKKL